MVNELIAIEPVVHNDMREAVLQELIERGQECALIVRQSNGRRACCPKLSATRCF